MKEIVKQQKDKDFQKLWNDSFVVFDEFDSVMFDGSTVNMCETFKLLKQAHNVTGLSGSFLNNIEVKCLQQVFGAGSTIIFPTLQQLCNDKRLKFDDKIFAKKDEYLSFMKSQAQEFVTDVPVVIVAENSAVQLLCKSLQNGKELSVHNLTLLPPEKLEVQIQKGYLTKDVNNNYGVYILNEQLAVGTDIPTNSDIDRKGGSFLIIGNIFSKRAEEQAKGRVGRFNNVCKWQRIVYNEDKNCTIEQYQSAIQDSLELKYEKKLATLLKLIEDAGLEEKQLLNPLLQNVNLDENNESSEDSAMQDVAQDQDSCSQITQNGGSYSNNEKSSSMYMGSDESFVGKGLEIKANEVRKKNKIKCEVEVIKKRVKKEQDKLNLQEKRLQQQHKEENEECKICREALITPHDCQMKENTPNIQAYKNQDPDGVVFDPSIFLKCDPNLNLDQISVGQSEISNRKNSEAGFQHILISENIEKSSPKGDIQLQKRRKGTTNTRLLEQEVNKSLPTQEKVVEGSKYNDDICLQKAVPAKKRDEMKGQKHQQAHEELKKSARLKAKQIVDYDALYFESYQTDTIHEEMLNDGVRMNVYQQSINEICKNQVVIDVGTGTGILSIFAAEAGASHVYGIEYTSIIEKAKDKVSQSDFAGLITLVKSKAEDVDLGQITVDVIVSEWMGYFLLFENMLPSVLSIRDKYLKEDGIMLPKRTSIHFAVMNKKCEDATKCMHTALVEQCEQEFLLSTSHSIFNFDLETDKMYAQKGFTSTFELVMLEDCLMTGFVAWFDAAMTDTITLSTSPQQPLTHWKQTLFYLPEAIEVQKDTLIAGKVIVGHQKENPRALWFTISYKTQTMKRSRSVSYSMD